LVGWFEVYEKVTMMRLPTLVAPVALIDAVIVVKPPAPL